MNRCPDCGYRFEDAESLRRHVEEGRGCPEKGGKPEGIDEYVKRVVAEAPPLTDEQARRVARLLISGRTRD